MFPIGGFTKDVVKKIAETSGFEKVARKRESMGICFIGKRKTGFADFIQVDTSAALFDRVTRGQFFIRRLAANFARMPLRVARWFVFKPKIPIWENFGGS
jgi:hypothetical protein